MASENSNHNAQNFVYDRDFEFTDPERLFNENRGRKYNFNYGRRSAKPRDLRTRIRKKEEAPVTMYNYQEFVDALVKSDVMQKIVAGAISQGMENKSAKELMELKVRVEDEIKRLAEEVNVIRVALGEVEEGLRVLGALVGQEEAQRAGEEAKRAGEELEPQTPVEQAPVAVDEPRPEEATLEETALRLAEHSAGLPDAALVRAVAKVLNKFTVNDILQVCQMVRPSFGGNYPHQAVQNALRRFRKNEATNLIPLEGTYPTMYKWKTR